MVCYSYGLLLIVEECSHIQLPIVKMLMMMRDSSYQLDVRTVRSLKKS